MSAFAVGPDHIDAMLTACMVGGRYAGTVIWQDDDGEARGITPCTSPDDMSEIGRMLAEVNADSVGHRYREEPNDLLAAVYRFRRVMEQELRVTPVVGLALIDCYEYQACEHPGWEASEARRFCHSLRKALIRRLPDYDEAPWEFTRQEVTV